MAYDVLFVDHGNPGSNKTFQQLKEKIPYVVQAEQQIKTSPYWRVSSYADIQYFDFDWQPNVHEKHFKHCGINNYGLADNGISLEHTMPSELHINNLLKIDRTDKHEIFYVDTGSHKNFLPTLEKDHTVQMTRFFDSWQKVAKRCANKMNSEYCWIVPSDVDPNTIDFTWYPDFWETNYLHIFGSKYQKNSGVMFVHRDWLEDTAEFKYRNDFIVRGDASAYDKFFLDFFDDNSKISFSTFDTDASSVRFFDNHFDTIKRLTAKSTTKYFWVISGNCNYERFDFSWLPDEDTYDHLHTFPSNDQPYGDTFFIDKHSFDIKSKQVTNFKHYETINFNTQQSVKRIPYDSLVIGHFDFAKAIKDRYKDTPTKYFWITNSLATPLPREDFKYDFAPDYWSPATIYTFAPDNDVMLVPKEAGTWINEQVYDYPHVKKLNIQATEPYVFDTVFVSNGEPDEQKHWNIIKEKCPRAKWVQGVKGRTKAYQAMATASDTDWFYACFAKSEIIDEFDFTWQPDRLKAPCHYIFNGRQVINGLEYGHGGVIMYEKHLTLATNTPDLDFTLSAKHDVVPMLSTIVYAGETEFMAWKTSFRECIKLHRDVVNKNDVDAKYRLKIWRTVGKGKNGEWSMQGGNDAVEFYDAVNGKHEDLSKSYEWEWLQEYFTNKYTSIEKPVIINK